MAHYTKKKNTGRKKLTKSKGLKSKKRVHRKRLTRKLRRGGGPGTIPGKDYGKDIDYAKEYAEIKRLHRESNQKLRTSAEATPNEVEGVKLTAKQHAEAQLKDIFINTNAGEVVKTTPVDVEVSGVKVRIVGETSIKKDGIVVDHIKPIARGYEIGKATTGEISMQLLKIIDAAIHNYDVENKNSGEKVPIPRLNHYDIEYTPVFIFRKPDGDWEIRLIDKVLQLHTQKNDQTPFENIKMKQYIVEYEIDNSDIYFTIINSKDNEEYELEGTIL